VLVAVLLLTISLAGPARAVEPPDRPTAAAEKQADPSVSPVRHLPGAQARPAGFDRATAPVVVPEGAALPAPALAVGVLAVTFSLARSRHRTAATGSRAPPATPVT